jgi:hypothetical protein
LVLWTKSQPFNEDEVSDGHNDANYDETEHKRPGSGAMHWSLIRLVTGMVLSLPEVKDHELPLWFGFRMALLPGHTITQN